MIDTGSFTHRIRKEMEAATMDATRARRTRNPARQVWYAAHRQRRFARFLGFLKEAAEPSRSPRLSVARWARSGDSPALVL